MGAARDKADIDLEGRLDLLLLWESKNTVELNFFDIYVDNMPVLILHSFLLGEI